MAKAPPILLVGAGRMGGALAAGWIKSGIAPIVIIEPMPSPALVERAKAILMQNRKMTEPEAYRWLQRKAMNENRKLGQIVTDFVAQHDVDRAKTRQKGTSHE